MFLKYKDIIKNKNDHYNATLHRIFKDVKVDKQSATKNIVSRIEETIVQEKTHQDVSLNILLNLRQHMMNMFVVFIQDIIVKFIKLMKINPKS